LTPIMRDSSLLCSRRAIALSTSIIAARSLSLVGPVTAQRW
jgi:hypothetical protein